jgi:hypothetical protein
MRRRITGVVLIAVGIIGLLAFPLYAGFAWNKSPPTYGVGSPWNLGMMEQPPQTGGARISFDEAVTLFQNYVTATGNMDLALKEVMEFENNFYAIVYERSTGVAAFELLVWKHTPSWGMMGGGMGMDGYGTTTGVVVPEPGPNMMWNTRYGMMREMMGSGWQTGTSSQMTVSEQDAKSIAENYLSQNLPGAHVEGITRFYGYYTIDFENDGKIIGMLSVNGYSGQVWYHSWHGAFIQENEFD